MKTIQVTQHFDTSDEIRFSLIEQVKPSIKKGECLVQVYSSGVNPSDALATLGYFSHTSLPRIPGRDFAGVVVEGSSQHIGKKVWGTGGAAGITTHGCLSEFMAFPENALVEIPCNLSLIQAGGQLLPYVTAYYSLVLRARIQTGEKVLVIGGLGQVGRAALSICSWKKCVPTALVRNAASVQKAEALGWTATTAIDQEYDVILNTIGNLHWEEQVNALKKFGRLVIIAAPEGKREASFNLFKFYRANQEFCGINTIDFNFKQNAEMLAELKVGFESGELIPLTIDPKMIFPLEQAAQAYQTVLGKAQGTRVLIQIQ